MWAVVAQEKTKTIEKFQMASTSVKCKKKKKSQNNFIKFYGKLDILTYFT